MHFKLNLSCIIFAPLLMLYLMLIHVLLAYADDIVVIVKTQDDVNLAGDIVKTYGKISAAKVNWEKSDALAVRRWSAGLPDLPGGLSWKRGVFKYLRGFFGLSRKEPAQHMAVSVTD